MWLGGIRMFCSSCNRVAVFWKIIFVFILTLHLTIQVFVRSSINRRYAKCVSASVVAGVAGLVCRCGCLAAEAATWRLFWRRQFKTFFIFLRGIFSTQLFLDRIGLECFISCWQNRRKKNQINECIIQVLAHINRYV